MVQAKRCRKSKGKIFGAAFGYGLRIALVPMDGDPDTPGGVRARVYREILITSHSKLLDLVDIIATPVFIDTPNTVDILEHLIQCATETWEGLGVELMPYRVDAVPKANRWNTKYWTICNSSAGNPPESGCDPAQANRNTFLPVTVRLISQRKHKNWDIPRHQHGPTGQ